MPVKVAITTKKTTTRVEQAPYLHAKTTKEKVLNDVHKISMDKSYLWYVKFLNTTPTGRYIYLPKLFTNWFPCENVVEPLGWNISPHSEDFYMTQVSFPETVGQQVITMSGIIDHIDKEVELWLLRWYNSFHFKDNVNLSDTNSSSYFHHAATLSEFARQLEVVRLTPKRNIAYSVTYYVSPRSDMQLSLNYQSGPKRIDALTLDIHGKVINDRQKYVETFFDELFAR